jgi:tetratricopeptide (TPR) repeat protein
MKNFDRGIVCAEELLGLGEGIEDPVSRLALQSNLAEFYRALGDRSRALTLLDRAAAAAAELYFLGPTTYNRTLRAQILFEQGRIEESIRCYEELIEIHRGEQSVAGAARSPHASALAGLAGVLRTLGEMLVMLKRGEEGLPHLEEAASCYGLLGDPSTEALLRSRVAAAHEDHERYARAQLEWEQVATLCRGSGDPAGECRALEGQARVARRQGEIERAVPIYHEALRLAETAGDEGRQGELYNTLGILAWRQRDYDGALAHYERALTIYEARDEPTRAGHVLASIGATLHRIGRSEEAVSRLDEAIRLHRRTHERQLEAYALGVLGDVHFSVVRHAQALTCYDASLRLRLEIGDRKGEGWMLLRLARVHAAEGRRDPSRTTAARAAAIAAEIGDRELTKGCISLYGSGTTPAGPPS